MENTRPFIFFLTLEERLPEQFYTFDRIFKEYDYILVPVRVDQLQQLVASTEQNHVMVISCTTNFREYRLFNEKVRKILKYVLKSRRLSFVQLSSFAKLNDTRAYNLTKNYFFLKAPVDARELTERMISFHDQKSEKSQIWPGGHKSLAGVA
jgi:hypothetical protein